MQATCKRFILAKDMQALTLPEKESLITYLQFRGVCIDREMKRYFTGNRSFSYVISNNSLFFSEVVAADKYFEAVYEEEIFTLEELKRYAQYF